MMNLKRLLNHAVTAAVGALALQAGVKVAHGRRLDSADTLSKSLPSKGGAGNDSNTSPLAAPAPAPGPDASIWVDPSAFCVPDFALFGADLGLFAVNDAFADRAACLTGTPTNADVLGSIAGVVSDVKDLSVDAADPILDELLEEIDDLTAFTNNTASCNDVKVYNERVSTSLEGISNTFGALQNVTLCDPAAASPQG